MNRNFWRDAENNLLFESLKATIEKMMFKIHHSWFWEIKDFITALLCDFFLVFVPITHEL